MSTSLASVCVRAPARLHLGFLDPGASLGRQFGSIGLSIAEIATVVSVRTDLDLRLQGLIDERVSGLVERILAHYCLPQRVNITVDERIPEHAGLGSGTQLALALGTALTHLFGVEVRPATLGPVLERGKRSGIGLSLFEHGGLIVDAGHGPTTRSPPVISRIEFPDTWPLILICDNAQVGLNGSAEIAAFSDLPSLKQSDAAHLCHLTLMQLLPSVLERDFAAFSAALGEIQAVIGDHFAAVQNGRFTSTAVAAAIEVCANEFALRGVGQSSWGPTAFAFVPDDAIAQTVLATLAARFAGQPQLSFRICRAHNGGASIAASPAHSGKAERHRQRV